MNLSKRDQPAQMCIHKQTPCPPRSSLVYQSPLSQPYLLAITWRQYSVFSVANHQSHLPNKAWLKGIICQIPNPPSWIEAQMVCQLTKWYLNSSPIPPHKKSLWIFSIHFAILNGMGNKKRKCAILERVLLIKVSLPPSYSPCVPTFPPNFSLGNLTTLKSPPTLSLHSRESMLSKQYDIQRIY